MISITGLGSGLDINGLVDSLVAAERAGSDLQLNRQSAKLQAKFTALGSLKSALSSFQTSLAGLTTISSFNLKSATSSDTSALSTSADKSAVSSSYSIQVNQLAASQSLASIAVADKDTTAIGTGTLTIRFGTTDYDSGSDTYNSFTENPQSSPLILTVDSSNNTLQGIMNAINGANAGIQASIINDGSGYRLVMTSTQTGEENSLQVTVADGDGNHTDLSGLSVLAFNASATNLDQTVAAQNANLVINGLSVTSDSNVVNSAIAGLSLTLKKVTTSPVKVTVQSDTSSVKDSVKKFVSGYNDFIKLSNALSAFNPDTREAAALVGDFTLRSIQNQVSSILRRAIPVQGATFSTLAELGITTSADGTLLFNDSKFDAALSSAPDAVMQLFAAFATAEDSNISFLGASKATLAGTYGVSISTLATAGFNQGTPVLPDFGGGGTVVVDGDNDNLTLTIDGVQGGAIALTHGTYTTGAALAAELQTRINNESTFAAAGVSVSVTYDSGANNLTITSDSTGSTSAVEVNAIDTTTPSTLGFLVGAGTAGVDMAGSIDGMLASGSGNILTAGAGSDAEGLRLEVNGNTLGSRGNVTFTRGAASELDALIERLLDIEGGLSNRIDSIENRLDSIEERREVLELRWVKVRERYLNQFNALDTLLGQLQNTSVFLEQQLGGLLKPNTGNNG